MAELIAGLSGLGGHAVLILVTGLIARIGWELGGRIYWWVRHGLGLPSRFTAYKSTSGAQWVVDDNSRIIRVDLPGDPRL